MTLGDAAATPVSGIDLPPYPIPKRRPYLDRTQTPVSGAGM